MSDGRLYGALPAFWRERDAEQGFALRALLSVIEGQAAALEDDIHRQYDGLFIETCDPWIIPYLGDLVGTEALFDPAAQPPPELWDALCPDLLGAPGRLMPAIAARARPDVAKTIHYRRRKGTAPMLEELARDVTGWPCALVESWARLGWTQWVRNRTRPGAGGWCDLRSTAVAERMRGPFDTASRSVDLRPFGCEVGREGIAKLAFFLWRLRGEPLDGLDARAHATPADWRWRASPLGQDAPLFTRARREGDEAGQAGELHLPAPVRPGALFEDLRAARAAGAAASSLYGAFGSAAGETSLSVTLIRPDGTADAVPAHRVLCMRLDPWQRPPGDRVGVDVANGRIALGAALTARAVRVGCVRGTVADLGGGSYPRVAWLLRRAAATALFTVGGESGLPTLRAALDAWVAAGRPDAVIRIADSRTHDETAAPLEIALHDPGAGRQGLLAIEAADRARPHLRLAAPLRLVGDHPESMLTLSGLVIEGGIELRGTLRRLRLLHCTLVPGRSIAGTGAATPFVAPTLPSLEVAAQIGGEAANTGLSVELVFSIAGPLRIPATCRQLVILDSVVDGVAEAAIAGPGTDAAAPPLTIERSTVLGDIRAARLPMMDTCLVAGSVRIARRDEGCLRFSYTRPDSRTPRRVRCQPDLAVADAIAADTAAKGAPLTMAERRAAARRAQLAMQPVLASRRYGQPAYAQLGRACPAGIAEGAEDGSAMGMTCHLKEPQRLANLRRRLDEYLPLGLEPGFVFVT
jgi:hypothetical protein